MKKCAKVQSEKRQYTSIEYGLRLFTQPVFIHHKVYLYDYFLIIHVVIIIHIKKVMR